MDSTRRHLLRPFIIAANHSIRIMPVVAPTLLWACLGLAVAFAGCLCSCSATQQGGSLCFALPFSPPSTTTTRAIESPNTCHPKGGATRASPENDLSTTQFEPTGL